MHLITCTWGIGLIKKVLVTSILVWLALARDSIYILGEPIWGAAKGVWFITVIVLGGLSLAFIGLSLSVIFYIGMITKKLNTKAHPWKPLLLSAGLLVIGCFFLSLAHYVEFSVRESVGAINDWYEYRIGDGFLHWFVAVVWIHAVIFLASFLLTLIIASIKLPFGANEHAISLREQR